MELDATPIFLDQNQAMIVEDFDCLKMTDGSGLLILYSISSLFDTPRWYSSIIQI